MALAPPPEEPLIDMGEEESENDLNPFLLPPSSTSPEMTPPPLPPRVTTDRNTGSPRSRGTAHGTDNGGIPESGENSGGHMMGSSRINPFAGPVAQPSAPQELSAPAGSSAPPPPPPPATRRPSQPSTANHSPSETMPPSVTPPEGSTTVARRRGSGNNSSSSTTNNSASRPGLPTSAGSASRPSRSPTRRGSARSTNTTVVDPPAWISARPPPPVPAPVPAPAPASTIPPIPTATPVPAVTVARVSASPVPLPNASTNSGGAATRSSSSPPANEQGAWSWGGIGRSFIGAMFGPSAVGRQGEGSRAENATQRPRAVRELTAHIMQQTADGKYNVSVWRRNKQDGRSIKVSVGLYDTAYEGQRAAEAFAPPKWQEPAKDSRCAVCNSTFGFLLKRRHHCRNCGRLVCSSCAETTWPRNMLPPTYITDQNERRVRVCRTCYNAGEQFRKALLAGSEEQAMAAYSTGCINLRVPYTIYHNELPVHCAAAGGNLNILAWLVEDRCCPIFLDRERKVALGDSRRLSVMGAAAASGHIQIMRYLAFTQGSKVTEIRDMNTLWNALEKCIFEGADVPMVATGLQQRLSGGVTSTVDRNDTTGGYPASTVGPTSEIGGSGAEVAAAIGDDDNMCIVCFERKVDCTLVPCGHHCCCMICAAQFEHCPVCRAEVTQKIRAISV